MKKLIFTLLVLCTFSTIKAAEVPLLQNIYARKHISLNGAWNYIIDPQEIGYYSYRMTPLSNGFFVNAKPKHPSDLIEYDFDKAETLQVPGDWNTQVKELFLYEGPVWLHRNFQYQKEEGKRNILYFGAVNYETWVWVNGKEMGHHVGGFTPFNFDVTDALKDGNNVIIIKADNKRNKDNVPTQIFDWWNYGGITRDVLLAEVDDSYVEDYFLQLQKPAASQMGNKPTKTSRTKTLNFWAKLNQAQAGEKISVSIPELKIKQTAITNAEGFVKLDIKINKLQLWSPSNPKLYKVEILHSKAKASNQQESISDEIAFRTIETRGKQILLNDEPIFLKGISIHEEKPFTQGRCNSPQDADTLLSWAKQLGCNYVRLAHYPHNEFMVREAEKMGIMVWSEIPCYWTISWENPDTYQNAQRQLHDMICRDKNRGNVIIWSIANETPHSKERDEFLSNLARYARTQDTTRLISMAMEVTGASNYVNRLNDNMNKYVDVISFNEYVGWYRDVSDAPKMRWEIPYDKPVIISEFGGGAKAGYHGSKDQRWTEEFQANLYKENLAMLDKLDGLAGTSPWILVDFRSPRRQLTGIQDFFNRKGLISDQGQKKQAFWIVKDWYKTK